ncbi:hypothetical protein AB0G35_24150 [Streptomyces sp. NPDC021749]|uniref:hypothetical protein n=1 Tax=Streptomyces sp. NPDC021749 TaxID=3154905 RepID=UPI0033CEDEB4
MEHRNTPSTPTTSTAPATRLSASEGQIVFATEVGPRVIGGIYHSAYWDTVYRVVGIHYGPDALAMIGWDAGWAITVQDAQGVRTHCTAWEKEDKIVALPEATVVYRPSHGALPLRHYSNLEAARAHVSDLLGREEPGALPVWLADDLEDPLSPVEACFFGRDGEPGPTGYVITPLTIADHYDAAG